MDTPLNPAEQQNEKDESGKKLFRKRNGRKGNNLLGSNQRMRDSGTSAVKLLGANSVVRLTEESGDETYLDPIGVAPPTRDSRERQAQVATNDQYEVELQEGPNSLRMNDEGN